MKPLDRKLLRDLWALKGQSFAISLVIGAGVAMFIMYLSTFASLRLTQATYYDRYRFADVFASLTRAPQPLREQLAAIPGVAQIETRVVVDVTLDVPGLREPASGRLIGIEIPRLPMLNDLFLRSGRYPDPGQSDEVVVSEAFALARGIGAGASIGAVINGRRRDLTIVGIALSPEYIYGIRPGELVPDDSRFGIFWMDGRSLAAAFDMEGGFNSVAVTLAPRAAEEDVIARLDQLLARYGGLGAIPRSLQTSHWYLDNELRQLQSVGLVLPVVFLLVAAFLLNVVLTRIVSVQREQIAALKALGYTNGELGWHYGKLGLLIGAAGSALGVTAGGWLGSGMTSLYNDFFRFPALQYSLPLDVVMGGIFVSFLASGLGALNALRRVAALPPAEAMRPEPPARYRRSWLERAGLARFISAPVRMILRNVGRHPVRAATSVSGIAAAVSMLILGTFFLDSIGVLMDQQFFVIQRQDVTVNFVLPASGRSLYEIGRLPGVLYAEPTRAVPARLRLRNRSRIVSIQGLVATPQLNRVVDVDGGPMRLPPGGIVLSLKLAEVLGARVGGRRALRQ
jgi:putative ABC transport system permease protein